MLDAAEGKPYALLFAASPELLEALKEAEALVIGWACHRAMQGAQTEADYDLATRPEGWSPTHRAIYDKVKTAIAKAEGR